MPTYRVTAPDGRSVKLTGDSPPTEAELEDVFAKLPKAVAGQPVPVAAPSELAGHQRALAGAETIGEQPWYTRNVGPLPSVTQTLAALPAVGGAVGGLLGGGGGLAGGPGTSLLGAVKGAALGGGAGEAFRQLGFRALGGESPATSVEAAKGIGGEALKQGASELVGQGVARGVSRVAAPFAGSVDKEVTAAAARQGVEMPASARSTSKLVGFGEGWAAGGPGGAGVTKRYLEATGHLTALADHTVARASKLSDDIARGEAIANGFDTFKANWVRTKTKMYKEVDDELPGLKVQAQETVKLLDYILEGKEGAKRILRQGPVADASFYEGLRDGLTITVGKGKNARRVAKPVLASDLQNAIREIDAKVQSAYADPFAASNKGLLEKLSVKLDEDFLGGLRLKSPRTAAKLEAANAVYQDGIKKINSTFGESIFKFAQDGKYDLIAKAVANPRMSVADVPRIMEVAGPEGTEAMQAAVLADIFAKAKGADGRLTPRGIGKAMKSYGEDRLQALLLPEQYATLSDLSVLSTSMERGQRVLNNSATAHFARVAGYPSAVTAGAMGHPGALMLVLGDVAYNRFISTKAGQRWLTTGKPLSAGTSAVLRQIPRAGVALVDQANEKSRRAPAEDY